MTAAFHAPIAELPKPIVHERERARKRDRRKSRQPRTLPQMRIVPAGGALPDWLIDLAALEAAARP